MIKSIFLLCLVSFSILIVNAQQRINLDELPKRATCQLTNDQHDSWLDWSHDDKYIAFISVKDSLNLCILDLEKLKIEKTGIQYFASSFMRSDQVEAPIRQLTFKREIVGSPRFHPSRNEVYFREYTCDKGCSNFLLKKIDLDTEEEELIYKGQVDWYTFENDTIIIFGIRRENQIKSLNINSGKTEVIFEESSGINGCDINDGRIAVACEDYISIYTFPDFKRIKKCDIESSMESLNLRGNYIFTTLRSSEPKIVKLNIKKNKYKVISNLVDYQPAVSNSNKFIARISDFAYGSIIISKVKIRI